jgi:hypothetical protein
MAEDIAKILTDVHAALDGFHTFLNGPVFGQIREGIKKAAGKIPQITVVIDKLIELLDALLVEIDKLDPDHALDQVPTFMEAVSALLVATEEMFTPPVGLEPAVATLTDIATLLTQIRELLPEVKTKLGELKP